MPFITPAISAIQSFISALRLKLGCINSITPPKAIAPIKTVSKPNRPVHARGKTKAVKAIRWTSLSLLSGAGSGASIGHSIANVRIMVTTRVRGMSRCSRIRAILEVYLSNSKSGCCKNTLRHRKKFIILMCWGLQQV